MTCDRRDLQMLLDLTQRVREGSGLGVQLREFRVHRPPDGQSRHHTPDRGGRTHEWSLILTNEKMQTDTSQPASLAWWVHFPPMPSRIDVEPVKYLFDKLGLREAVTFGWGWMIGVALVMAYQEFYCVMRHRQSRFFGEPGWDFWLFLGALSQSSTGQAGVILLLTFVLFPLVPIFMMYEVFLFTRTTLRFIGSCAMSGCLDSIQRSYVRARAEHNSLIRLGEGNQVEDVLR
ncbi:hypothetical protein BJ170DRAFT_730947 [Xylariales sp. AK1849]|nr:hypothetical protein BJ170DRAFT_730947 [Xylariales sp. AK1849]